MLNVAPKGSLWEMLNYELTDFLTCAATSGIP